MEDIWPFFLSCKLCGVSILENEYFCISYENCALLGYYAASSGHFSKYNQQDATFNN